MNQLLYTLASWASAGALVFVPGESFMASPVRFESNQRLERNVIRKCFLCSSFSSWQRYVGKCHKQRLSPSVILLLLDEVIHADKTLSCVFRMV